MKTLVILHGWRSSSEKWKEVGRLIEESGIRVLIPDLPGFIEGNRLDRPWSVDDYVGWLEEYVVKNVEGELYLMGHSAGGGFSVKYASKHDVSGMILVAAAVVRIKDKKVLLMAKISKILKLFSFMPGYSLFRKFVYYKILRRSDYINAEGHLQGTLKNVVQENLEPLLSKIDTKTLILWGDQDDQTPIEDAHMIHSRLKNSELSVFEGVGHVVHRDADTSVLANKIISFIQR